MHKILRRDFELQIENGINVIVCVIPFSLECKKCVKDLDDYSSQYPFVIYNVYDISSDLDISETYEIVDVPTILIFKDGVLVDKFVYTNLENFTKKLDIESLAKKEQ